MINHLVAPPRYPSGPTQVGLIGMLLSGTTLAWFAPLLEQQFPLLNDLEAFVEEFNTAFGDFDKERILINKLQALC